MCRWSTELNGGRWNPDRTPVDRARRGSPPPAPLGRPRACAAPSRRPRRRASAREDVRARADEVVPPRRGLPVLEDDELVVHRPGTPGRRDERRGSGRGGARAHRSACAPIFAQNTHVSGRGARSSGGNAPHVRRSSVPQATRPIVVTVRGEGAGGGARGARRRSRGGERGEVTRDGQSGDAEHARGTQSASRARAKTWPTCDDRGTRSLGEETQATPVSSRSSALCKRVLRSEWHPRIWRNCSYPIWASSMQKVHSAGIQCALFYYLSTLKPLFVVRAQPWRLALARAHRDARASSAPHFAARVPLRAIPALPPRARTPDPRFPQRSPAMSYDDEFDEPPPSRRGDLRVPHFVSRSETDYFNEVELMSEECASRSRDPRDPRSPRGPERTAPRATRPRRGTRGGKP